jgi:5-methylcytosine-specific restriction endonuclease McrA
MKLCWDNLENIRINSRGNFKDIVSRNIYYYHESCKNCNEPFLDQKKNSALFCSKKCSTNGKYHPNYGKTLPLITRKRMSESRMGHITTEETKKKLSKANKGKKLSEETKQKLRVLALKENLSEETIRKRKEALKHRKPISEETRKKLSKSSSGRRHTEEAKRKISESHKGKNSYNWNGYTYKNIPTYDIYAPQLEWCEEVRRSPKDGNILEVKCTNCGKWYVPKRYSVNCRIQSLKGNYKGENRLYCSKACKKACPIYHKTPETLMKEDAVRAGKLKWLELGREVQAELRQMVLERDNHTCRKCGTTESLHCHHIKPVAIEPIESADIDNCITLCEVCHKEAHKNDGCRYGQLRMETC